MKTISKLVLAALGIWGLSKITQGAGPGEGELGEAYTDYSITIEQWNGVEVRHGLQESGLSGWAWFVDVAAHGNNLYKGASGIESTLPAARLRIESLLTKWLGARVL